jgi:hypothetical protein
VQIKLDIEETAMKIKAHLWVNFNLMAWASFGKRCIKMASLQS